MQRDIKEKKPCLTNRETNLNERLFGRTQEMNKRDKRFSVRYLKLRWFVWLMCHAYTQDAENLNHHQQNLQARKILTLKETFNSTSLLHKLRKVSLRSLQSLANTYWQCWWNKLLHYLLVNDRTPTNDVTRYFAKFLWAPCLHVCPYCIIVLNFPFLPSLPIFAYQRVPFICQSLFHKIQLTFFSVYHRSFRATQKRERNWTVATCII